MRPSRPSPGLSPPLAWARLRAMQRLGTVAATVTAVFVSALSAAHGSGVVPDYEAARAHYRAGQEAAADGRYDEAARAYEAAYALTADPILHFRIADAYQHAGACERALEHYQRYLDEANPPEAYAEIALRRVNACQDEILAAREDAARGEPGDGEVPREPPPREASAAREDASRSGGPADAPSSRADTPDRPEPRQVSSDALTTSALERDTWHRGAAWTSTGVAVVLAATSGIMAASARARERDLERLLSARDADTDAPPAFEGHVAERYMHLQREGERYARASQLALGAAGAAAITAAVLAWIDPTRGGRADVALTSRPEGGLGVAASWEF
jgi:hypothetical protein